MTEDEARKVAQAALPAFGLPEAVVSGGPAECRHIRICRAEVDYVEAAGGGPHPAGALAEGEHRDYKAWLVRLNFRHPVLRSGWAEIAVDDASGQVVRFNRVR